MGEIHVTERNSFKWCRRYWWWSTRENLVALEEPRGALWFGRGVHYGLAAYYRDGVDAVQAFRDWVDRRVPPDDYSRLDEAGKKLVNDYTALGVSMLTLYQEFETRSGDDFTVQGVEYPLSATIPGCEHQLVGTLDIIVRSRGRLWVVDHKTVSSFVDPRQLEMDDQMTSYLWLVWQTFGEMPAGAIYNQLRKRIPAEPYVLQNGGLSKARSIDTTYDAYLGAIHKNNLDPADYTEILEQIKSNEFIRREYVARSPTQLKLFGEQLRLEASDMLDPNVRIYPSPRSDCPWSCQFYAPCTAESAGGDTQSLKDTLFKVQLERTE